jgi:hypothetical protein
MRQQQRYSEGRLRLEPDIRTDAAPTAISIVTLNGREYVKGSAAHTAALEQTPVRHIVRSSVEARAYLAARGDSTALTDEQVPWHLLRRYNVVCDGDAPLAAPPPVRVDDAPDAPATAPRQPAPPTARAAAFALLAEAHADRSRDHVDGPASPAAATPAAPGGAFDPFAAYRRAYDEARR